MTAPEATEVEPRAGAAPAAGQPARASRPRAERGPVRVVINRDWCKGCYICVSVCPRDVLAIAAREWTGSSHPVIVAQPDRCTACRNCELLCPDLAITVSADEAGPEALP